MLSPSSRFQPTRTPTHTRDNNIAPLPPHINPHSSINSPSFQTPLLQTTTPLPPKPPSPCQQQVLAIVYGLINTILTVPCMYGYAMIIFSDPFFNAYTPSLCKLVLLSSAIHQCIFSVTSSLPYAIGQVQDAGLLFLHEIATSIVKTGQTQAWDDQEILSTVLVTLSLSTALLGLALILIGQLKLASLVAYLPATVVGGYLAFIGYFCLLSGFNLCTGLIFNANINDGHSFATLFGSSKLILLSVPGLVGGVVLLMVSSKCKHVACLPIAIVGMPLLFYIVLGCMDFSMADARTAGWIDPPSTNTTSFVHVFDMFQFQKVQWQAMPAQWLTWVSMTFVVSFSSSLDVAAIEMDIGKQLKINHELKTVGLSNVVSGLLGGYTGSYIFSQTIFTSRTNIHSRLVGIVVIVSELALFMLPISIMTVIPKFFFAATLMFIAFDLMFEWLVASYSKLLFREYCLIVITLGLIIAFGLQTGMLIAVVVAGIGFVHSYSRTSKLSVSRLIQKSNVLAPEDDRVRIEQAHREIVTLTIHGFVFFGTAKSIVNDVFKNVHVFNDIDEHRGIDSSNDNDDDDEQKEVDALMHALNKPWSPNLYSQQRQPHRSSIAQRPQTVKSRNRILRDHFTNGAIITLLNCVEQAQGETIVPTNNDGDSMVEQEEDPLLPTRVLVLDFQRCHGMDATAVKSCFSVCDQLCTKHGITVICCGCSKEIKFLLDANGLAQWKPGTYNNVDEALVWAEELVQNESSYVNRPIVLEHHVGKRLANLGQQQPHDEKQKSLTTTEESTNESINDENKGAHNGRVGIVGRVGRVGHRGMGHRTLSMEATHQGMVAANILRMAKCQERVTEQEAQLLVDSEYFFEEHPSELSKGTVLYRKEMASDMFYIVKKGRVDIVSSTNTKRNHHRNIIVKEGFIFGESAFCLHLPRDDAAVVARDGTEVWVLHRRKLEQMEVERPDVYKVFQKMMMRVMAHQVRWAKDF